MPDGVPVELPGRDARLPHYYRQDSHPLLRGFVGVKNVYVYLQDTSPEAMLQYYDFVKHQVFPTGTEAGISAAGKQVELFYIRKPYTLNVRLSTS